MSTEQINIHGTRHFKGVWIPSSLYLSKDLSWTEKMLLVEIDSLSEDKGFCYASNAYLARFIGTTAGNVANILTELRRNGYVVCANAFHGGKMRRHLRVTGKVGGDKFNNPPKQ